MPEPLRIGKTLVGNGQPCFIIAEAGVNHNGDAQTACKLVDAAADAGTDAVKFQSFKTDHLITSNAPKAEYQRRHSEKENESQDDMLRQLELSEEAHRQIFEHCKKRKILFLSTPFDEKSADLLEQLGVEAYKIPSGELTNLPLIRHVAQKGRPMIISTGMATLPEVEAAVEAAHSRKNSQIILLHCVSHYPMKCSEANLRAMRTMADRFDCPTGFSDHSEEGVEVALAAVALGACVIERHFTLDTRQPGPDHFFSLEPALLQSLVRGIRHVESALGDGRKAPAESEFEMIKISRKSLVSKIPIKAGTQLTNAAVTAKRPGTGMAPSKIDELLGRTAKYDIHAGEILTRDMFD